MRRKKIILCFKLVLITSIIGGEAQKEVTYEEDTAITASEKKALGEFKKAVIHKIPKESYILNYIKDDLFFIKWLRAASFNVENAEILFLEVDSAYNHLKWRKSYSLDTASVDDFPGFEREFPFFLNITDRRHRPTAEIWVGDWKVREAALSGQGSKLVKWFVTCFELLLRNLYEARYEGVKVSQAVVVMEVSTFNLVQTGCPACLPIIAAMALNYARHFPGLLESFIVIKASKTPNPT